MNHENLGPAERIIQTLLTYNDHLYHGRPGFVVSDPSSVVGVRWSPVTHQEENGEKVVYRLNKVGKKTERERLGVIQPNNQIKDATNRVVGEYRPAGLFKEVAEYMYRQVAEVWKLDNEFAARWASYAFGQEHRDLKVVLAAFLLCQSRKGDPVVENGQVVFHDEDYRDVGEAMMLLFRKDAKDFNPKLLLRVRDVLALDEIATINRELGFGKSARKPFMGRWTKAVQKWLQYREKNTKLLEGLVKAGFRTTVMDLSRAVGYKPSSDKFFQTLRWKQKQAVDGRRTLAIGQAVSAAQSWTGLSEEQICQKIVDEKLGFKRLVGLLPKEIGLTRAIVAAAMEAGSLSDKDLIIFTPTLEELGLLQVNEIRQRWEKAVKNADDLRAANIAKNVKSKEVKDRLQEGADTAAKKAVEEVSRNIRLYFVIDRSGSMEGALQKAKEYLPKFLQAFDQNRVHVSSFNTVGREIKISHASSAGVENALKGIAPSGGTMYAQGVKALAHHKPNSDEDVLMIFVGDEECTHANFVNAVRESGLNPMAFGLIRVLGRISNGRGAAVRATANELGIPCFMIDEKTFDDPYAIPRTIRQLVQSTPVGKSATVSSRVSLLDIIAKTELLKKPVWA